MRRQQRIAVGVGSGSRAVKSSTRARYWTRDDLLRKLRRGERAIDVSGAQ